ncbi:MAG TPA: hypothetical protein VEC36_12290, partial [Patescibacteria group bacterium]|nr:hypothetical protein [Patescibacteria group bacterium]
MNFQQKLASYVLGILKDSDLIDIAETAIEEGFKNKKLEIVASLPKTEYSSVIQDFFKRALQELNLRFPDIETAFKIMLDYYTEEMRKKQISVNDGINIIERLILYKLDEKENLK